MAKFRHSRKVFLYLCCWKASHFQLKNSLPMLCTFVPRTEYISIPNVFDKLKAFWYSTAATTPHIMYKKSTSHESARVSSTKRFLFPARSKPDFWFCCMVYMYIIAKYNAKVYKHGIKCIWIVCTCTIHFETNCLLLASSSIAKLRCYGFCSRFECVRGIHEYNKNGMYIYIYI